MTCTYPEIARILLEKGADPNVKDPDVGRTPLHNAVAYGTPGTVMCLLQGGADVTIKERLFGNTPMHIAAEEGKGQVRNVLHETCERKFVCAQRVILPALTTKRTQPTPCIS